MAKLCISYLFLCLMIIIYVLNADYSLCWYIKIPNDWFFFFLVVLKCLQARYKAKVFYTHAGCSLVALNPFQPMPHLYRQDVMKQYHFAPQPQVFTTSHETNCNSHICKYSFSVFKRNMFRAVLCETIAKTFQIKCF